MSEVAKNGWLIPTTLEEEKMWRSGAAAAQFQIADIIRDWKNQPPPTAEQWPQLIEAAANAVISLTMGSGTPNFYERKGWNDAMLTISVLAQWKGGSATDPVAKATWLIVEEAAKEQTKK